MFRFAAPPKWMLKKLIPKEAVKGFEMLSKACRDTSKWPEEIAHLAR